MIVEKDVCPCGALIGVERVEMWGKVDETIASNFLFLLILGKGKKEGESATLSTLTHHPPGIGG